MSLETELDPGVASALLGHAQISTVLDVYSDVVSGPAVIDGLIAGL
jgi:site-specific recombinase XerD